METLQRAQVVEAETNWEENGAELGVGDSKTISPSVPSAEAVAGASQASESKVTPWPLMPRLLVLLLVLASPVLLALVTSYTTMAVVFGVFAMAVPLAVSFLGDPDLTFGSGALAVLGYEFLRIGTMFAVGFLVDDDAIGFLPVHYELLLFLGPGLMGLGLATWQNRA
jgi:hypothetical protein